MVKKLKNGSWYLMSFILPITIVIIAYASNGIYWGSAHSILASDAFTQGANFLASFREVLHGKNSLWFNWQAGFGLNYLALYSYYLGGIVTPLVGLFSKNQIPNAFYVITIFKIGLAGLSSFSYLKHQFKIKRYQQLLLAISYATMSFGLVNAEQIMWLDVLYILPLIVWGVDQWIEQQRWGLLFISWFLMLVTNFYIAFMVGLFIGIYYLTRLITLKVQQWWINIGQFIGIMLWSTISSGVIILPVILTLSRNKMPLSSMNGIFTDRSGLWDLPVKSMIGAYDGTKFGTTPYIYVGLIVLIYAVSYFFNRQIARRVRVGYAVLLLSLISGFYLQFFNLTWQGWHFPAMFLYRYSFLWSFVMMQLAAYELEVMVSRLEAKIGIILGSVMLVATVGSFNHYHFISIWNLVATLLFLIVEVLLIFSGLNKKVAIGSLVLVSILELTINAGLMFKGVATEWHYPSASLFNEPAKAIKEGLPKIRNDRLRRVENLDSISRDDGLRFNYGSANFFSSVTNRPFEQSLNQLGFRSTGSNLNMTYGNNTLVMDSILGTQTNLALQPVDKYGFQMATRSGKFYVSNNQNALKNGIVVEQKLAENEKLSKTDNLGNQNQLLSLVAHTSVTKRLFKSFPVQLTGSTGQTAEAGLEFKNLENGNQSLKLSVTVPKNQQAYLSLFKMQGSISQISVYKGKQLIENYNPNLVGQYINLGSFKQRTNLNISIRLSGTGTAQFARPTLITLNEKIFQRQIELARKYQATNLKYGKRTIKGNITTNNDKKALLLTIPADPGWKAKINGKQVAVKTVDNLFTLVPLNSGKNQLTMKYVPTGLVLGAWLTILGLSSFIFVQIWRRYDNEDLG